MCRWPRMTTAATAAWPNMWTALETSAVCAAAACEELLLRRIGIAASAPTMSDPTDAAAIALSCGLIPIIRQSSTPAAPVTTNAIGIKRNPLTPLILVHADALFDQQIHARRQAEHRSDHHPPGGPSVFPIQPAADNQTEPNADGHLQPHAGHRTPIGVLILRHGLLRLVGIVAAKVCAFLHKLRSTPTPYHKPGG